MDTKQNNNVYFIPAVDVRRLYIEYVVDELSQSGIIKIKTNRRIFFSSSLCYVYNCITKK